ncbi:unnamed protein product [Parnassius mnemosyne]|uniref:Uncharacterized protein n=1 Tax=Parnassius mnemosyne TaxID=213953 RepID=A0AAV1KEQ2_9NEOP
MPRKSIRPKVRKEMTQMKFIKARLMEITLKVDNYIYKDKPISKRQAKTYLEEISSFITRCNNDIGYLQVIEKLTKYMNFIISSETTKAKVSKATNQDKIAVLATNTGSSLSPVSSTPVNDKIQNQHNTDEISESNGNCDSNNNNTNCQEDEQNARNKTAEIEKPRPEVSTIDNLISKSLDHLQASQNILENYIHAESIDNADALETNSVFSKGECQNVNANVVSNYINKNVGNIIQDIASLKLTEKSVNNNNRQGTNEEILKTDALSKEKSALNAVTLNTTYHKIQINTHEKIDEKTKTVNTQPSQLTDVINVNVLTDGVNKKKVTFDNICNEIPTQNVTSLINMHNGVEGNGKLPSSRIKKIENGVKPSYQNPQKKARSTIKRQKKETSNCKVEKKTKRNTNRKKIITACEDKSAENSNKISLNTSSSLHPALNTINEKIEDDLSWLDQIKYVREVDAREYCTVVKGLDDNFWENETVPNCDDEEFKV